MDYNELYCRWAEDKYKLKDVTSVEFEPRYVEGCPTCGGDNYLEVGIRYGKNRYKSFEESYATELINSIMAFKQ